MEFLKTILIILLVYFGLKFLLKWAWPHIVKYMMKKAAGKFEQAFNNQPFQQQKDNTEGEITIDRTPQSKKTSKDTVGEYVDFEEVK